MKLKSILCFCLSLLIIFELVGCDAFVRKFTRKKKKDNMPQEEMVVSPQEYPAPVLSKEQLYRKYFLYWQSWQDELIEALLYPTSRKRMLDCADQSIQNLKYMQVMLNDKAKAKLDNYINQMQGLRSMIDGDIYNQQVVYERSTAERVRRDIFRDFPYHKIKDKLI